MEGRELKYVILKTERAVLLAPSLNHADAVGPNVRPESAGLCRLGVDDSGELTVSCYGESLTLGLKSRKKTDADIIKRTLSEPERV